MSDDAGAWADQDWRERELRRIIGCEHFDLGPPDKDGVSICASCGDVVVVRIAGLPVEEYEGQRTTRHAREGDDVSLP